MAENIYEKEYANINEVFDEIKALTQTDSYVNRRNIATLYTRAKKAYDAEKQREYFIERAGYNDKFYKVLNVHVLNNDSAIIEIEDKQNGTIMYEPVTATRTSSVFYENFEDALVGLLCLKTDNENAFPWICKILDLDKLNQEQELQNDKQKETDDVNLER